MFTAIRAETAHSPTYQLLRGELKRGAGGHRNLGIKLSPARGCGFSHCTCRGTLGVGGTRGARISKRPHAVPVSLLQSRSGPHAGLRVYYLLPPSLGF